MNLKYLTEERIKSFIDNALKEDVGDGDHTSLAAIPSNANESAHIIAKGNGIIAGVELSESIFHAVDSKVKIQKLIKDGDTVKKGDVILNVKGKAQSILTAERLVLNCMQRMSGIATYTNSLQKMISHTKAKVLDTRKTTPNFRICEKWAVVIGGGVNHRYGLYDMILLKDNHVDYAGSIEKTIQNTQKYLSENKLDLKIELETRNFQEVKEACEIGGMHRIMLDNMTNGQMKEAVEYIGGRFEVEASGGITEDTIVGVAETGVDFISIGALTHSYKSLDLSLKATK